MCSPTQRANCAISCHDRCNDDLITSSISLVTIMGFLVRSLLACLAFVILCAGCLPSRSSAMGLPRPRPDLNFTVGVEGVVWCTSCRHSGYAKSPKAASPLPNAAALLRCRRGRRAMSVWAATDAQGYFLAQTGRQAAPFTSRSCKVYVLRSPARGCRVAVQPRRLAGSPLRFRGLVTLPGGGLQARYSAGNFTFAPRDPAKC
ncbi:hypothetical protein ACP4OV_025125 [Aristida adscensionis]